MEHITALTTRPSYFRGQVVCGLSKSVPIGIFRSWQHKESRRADQDLTKLLQSVMWQAQNGYMLNALQYFVHTIFPEDIGLAASTLVIPLATCLTRWEKVFKETKWPLDLITVQSVLSDLYKTCELIGHAPKNRFIPSLITISVMYHVRTNWSPFELSWSERICKLQHILIDSTKNNSINTKTIDWPIWVKTVARPLTIQLEDCLLYLDWMKHTKQQTRKYRQALLIMMWQQVATTPYGTINEQFFSIRAIDQLNTKKHCRLWYYLMFLMAVLPQDWFQTPKLNVSDTIDLDRMFQTILSAPPAIPDYALDKHTGGSGGYKKFQKEGIYVPPNKLWLPDLHQELSDESFALRFAYEKDHGPNSSKTAKIVEKLTKQPLHPPTTPTTNNHITTAIATTPIIGEEKSASSLTTTLLLGKRQRSDDTESKESKQPLPKKPKTMKSTTMMQPALPVFVGQPITGRHKKYVYIYPEVVKKGPYMTHEQNAVKWIVEASETIKKINQAQGVSATVVTPTVVTPTVEQDGTYLCWPNLGDYSKIKTEQRTTKLAEDVTVISRKSMIYRASDYGEAALSEPILIQCLNHLYARYICGVGDSGLWNILIHKDMKGSDNKISGEAIGIDLDEKRSFEKIPTSTLQCLFSKIYRADFWQPRVRHISQVSLEWAAQNLSPQMAERVRLFASFQ
jgi:hypothetical protein